MESRHLLVVEIGSNVIVRRIDVTGKSDRAVERVERGLLINMDTDRYFVRDTAERGES